MTTILAANSATAAGRRCSPPRRTIPLPLAVRTAADVDARTAWAQYVEQTPGGSLFHDPHWCDIVRRVFGHRPLHLLATRGTQTVGVLPLMEVDSLIGGRLHISVPYGTYGGLLADDDEVAAALTARAVAVANERGARVLELRSAVARAPGLETVPGYLGFRRALPEDAEAVPAFVPKRARAAARHARERDGVRVEHFDGTCEEQWQPALRLVWGLYCRSMRRLGSINYPYRFFVELTTRLGARAWITVAWRESRPVAGTLSFLFRDTIMPYILGADDRVPGDGVANLLYLEVMERAVRGGLRYFDYGRSRADNAGAVGFKKNQGFEPQPLGYQRYVPPGRRAPDLRPTNPRFAIARRIWRRLPLCVTRTVGAWAAASLPG
jgi:FemAB-related protein (PEP-CTERM system-associated)